MGDLLHLNPLRGQLQRSITLAPQARAAGVSIRQLMANREERRRVEAKRGDTKRRWQDLTGVVAEARLLMAAERNELDCCAGCGEPMPARSFRSWAERVVGGETVAVVGHVGCL